MAFNIPNEDEFEDFEANPARSRGTFVKWATLGQKYVGRVVGFDPEGGYRFGSDERCPQLVLQVAETGHEEDDYATIADPPTNLSRQLVALNPEPGWWVSVAWTEDVDVGKGNPMKKFKITKIEVAQPEVAQAGAIAGTVTVGAAAADPLEAEF